MGLATFGWTYFRLFSSYKGRAAILFLPVRNFYTKSSTEIAHGDDEDFR